MVTLSPGKIRMKFILNFPLMVAKIWCPFKGMASNGNMFGQMFKMQLMSQMMNGMMNGGNITDTTNPMGNMGQMFMMPMMVQMMGGMFGGKVVSPELKILLSSTTARATSSFRFLSMITVMMRSIRSLLLPALTSLSRIWISSRW